VAAGAWVAPTAQVVGNVIVGEGSVVDYGAVIVSSGSPVRLDEGVVVMPGAVIRSVGGAHRPGFPVHVRAESLVGPLAALAGCSLGAACYVATGVMVFQGAVVGEGSRLGRWSHRTWTWPGGCWGVPTS
jgi:carbonic anhydrase/acetyltransferase-like protein (isoleucine patch superfamily)